MNRDVEKMRLHQRGALCVATALALLAVACGTPVAPQTQGPVPSSTEPVDPSLPTVPVPADFRPVDNDCSGGYVSLTFDDGPDVYTEALLDRLDALNMSATFFILGNKVAGREATLQREVKDGHTLESHGWDHTDLATGVALDGKQIRPWGEAQIREQVRKTNAEIQRASGVTPTSVRPPYGSSNQMVKKSIEAEGLELDDPHRRASIESNDWDGDSSKQIVKNIVEGTHSEGGGLRRGAVVVQHDGAYDTTLRTIGAMQGVADAMNDRKLCTTKNQG